MPPSDDHFETHRDEIKSGNVGTLNYYASLLRHISIALACRTFWGQ